MLRQISVWCLMACLFVMVSTATAQERMPDLTPVVVDANKGSIEIRNIGETVAAASQIFVVCSVIRSGRSTPCAAGLHLPGYIAKWNTLPIDIPALQPGGSYLIHLFGAGAFPRQAGIYGMKITADPRKHIAESIESNNYARLNTTIRGGSGKEVASSGLLQVKVLMDGKPVKSAIVITRPGKQSQVVLQTESIPGERDRHMKQTPFEVALPVGKYDLYVHTELSSPLKIYMQMNAVPIVIKKGERLEKSVTIPSGRIRLSTTVEGNNAAGMKVDIQGSGRFNNNFQYLSSHGVLETPVDVSVPVGKYRLSAQSAKEKQTQTANVEIKSGSTIKKSLNFDKLHAGYLKLSVLMDGKPIPFEFGWTSAARGFLSDEYLFSSETGEPVAPLGGSSAQPMKLRVGVYDIKIHEHAVGGKDIVIKGIVVREGETVEKIVEIHQPGSLNIMARWTHQPLNIVACAKYHNPINLNRLGALMGGGSGSGSRARGDCLSPEVRLRASVSSPGRSDGDIARFNFLKGSTNKNTDGQIAVGEYIETIEFNAGVYDVAVWPVDHRELEQILKGVEIAPGGVIQRKLEFRWPGKKKK